MKHSIAFALALSAFASAAAFANPETVIAHQYDAQTSAVMATRTVASDASFKPFDSKNTSTMVVAENRKEFGSRYERNE